MSKLPSGRRRVRYTAPRVRPVAGTTPHPDAEGGNIRPGIKRLAQDCRMADSTVKRHLNLLRDRGFVVREDRGGRNGDGSTRASRYRLSIPSSKSQNRDFEGESQSLTCEASKSHLAHLKGSAVRLHQVIEQVK